MLKIKNKSSAKPLTATRFRWVPEYLESILYLVKKIMPKGGGRTQGCQNITKNYIWSKLNTHVYLLYCEAFHHTLEIKLNQKCLEQKGI